MITFAASTYHFGHCCGFYLPLFSRVAASAYHRCGFYLLLFSRVAPSAYHFSSVSELGILV